MGAISRAAVAAYERETMVGSTVEHRLCDSAIPVPRGTVEHAKYMHETVIPAITRARAD